MFMINKFISFISSMKFALLLIIIFAFSIGYATFIENDYGTATAKALIYNVWWFDSLLILLCVSLFFNMLRFNVFSKDKLATLTFHLSFILILIGAGITRFTGEEGMIVIDEGDSSSTFYTNDPYFQLSVTDEKLRENNQEYTKDVLLNLNSRFKNNPLFLVKYLRSNYFKLSSDKGFFPNGWSGTPFRFKGNNVYKFNQKFTIEYVDFITNADSDRTKNMISQSDEIKDGMISALVVKTSSLGRYRIDTLVCADINTILEGKDYARRFTIGDLNFDISYGSKTKSLPFSIYLKDFQLEKYPGSELPSSFASEVQVRDNSVIKDYRIYMNNTLNYKGYRFFQSNYGTNSKGVEYTVLSVNSDWWGTRVTYLGYLIMAIGMILVFFQKRTRFSSLSAKLKKLRNKPLIFLFLLSPLCSFSQSNSFENDKLKFNVKEPREQINKLAYGLSGDTIVNGESFYNILLKGREDVQYLINAPIINISNLRKYFPETQKNFISYITYNDYFSKSADLQDIHTRLIDDLKNGRSVNYSDTSILKLFYSCDQFFELVNILIDNEIQQIKSLTSINENSDINESNAINFISEYEFDNDVVDQFQRLLIQDNGRIKPIHTMALEYIRKITKSSRGMYGKKPIDMFLGMITFPDYWSRVPLIKVEHEKVKSLFGIDNDYISYMDFLDKLRSEKQLSPCNIVINIKSKSSESLNTGTNVSLDEMDEMQLVPNGSITFKDLQITFNNPKKNALNFYCENGDLSFSYSDTLEFMTMPPDSTGSRQIFNKNVSIDQPVLITVDSNRFFVNFINKVDDCSEYTSQSSFSCQYDLASRKEEKNRSKFDKEILKVGERYTILIKMFNYSAFRLLPIIDDENDTWAVNSQRRVTSNHEFLGFKMTSRSDNSTNRGQNVSLDDMMTKSINLRESINFKSIPITLDAPIEGALNFFYFDDTLSCMAPDTIKVIVLISLYQILFITIIILLSLSILIYTLHHMFTIIRFLQCVIILTLLELIR